MHQYLRTRIDLQAKSNCKILLARHNIALPPRGGGLIPGVMTITQMRKKTATGGSGGSDRIVADLTIFFFVMKNVVLGQFLNILDLLDFTNGSSSKFRF